MELSGTATVVLAMIAARPRSGYEIKQLVDGSTRFFWAASYGQIYPELKRLAEAGMIEGSDASAGGRRRTVYEITPKGRKAIREWLARRPEACELRDEALLKLFFAGVVEPKRASGIAAERAEQSERAAQTLRELEAEIEANRDAEDRTYDTDLGSETVLRFGVELNEWTAKWWRKAERELAAAKPAKKRSG